MYRGAAFSALLHVAVVAFAYFGLPQLFSSDFVVDQPIPVEIVTIAEETNVPPPPLEPEPPPPEPPKAKPPPPPEPPKPAETKAPEPPPLPPEPAKPEPPKAVAAAPAPVPKAKPTALLKAKKIKPKRKPPPPNQMASVLRTVEKLKRTVRQETPREEKVTAMKVPQRRQPPREFDPNTRVTVSERDAIRRHFERCWNVPAGARDAANLIAEIRVAINPDGWVREARIVDVKRMAHDPFFRAAAESALRAVLNPSCRSLRELNLPAEKYPTWKDMTIRFDPTEMFGT